MRVYLTQPDIDNMIKDLVYQVQSDKRHFTRVVGIANGGLPVSKPLAAALGLPHESVRISHYNDAGQARPVPIIEGQLSHPTGNLIVDELIDHGKTINTFDKHFGLKGNTVAVLFWCPDGPKPDFYVEEKLAAWIVFPWEIEECVLKNT